MRVFFSPPVYKNKAQRIIPHTAELFENSNQSWLSETSYNILELQAANDHIPTTPTALARCDGDLSCSLQQSEQILAFGILN